MVYCAVVGCKSRTQSKAQKLKTGKADCGFFRIPRIRLHECEKAKELSERRQREWLTRINRRKVDANPEKYQICSRHFVSGRPSKLFDHRNPDWTPSLHMCSAVKSPNQSRYRRTKPRSHRPFSSIASRSPARAEPTPSEDMHKQMFAEETKPTDHSRADAVCQTDLSAADIKGLEDEISSLKQQLVTSKEASCAASFTEEALQGSNDRVIFYTGLCSTVLDVGANHTPHKIAEQQRPSRPRHCQPCRPQKIAAEAPSPDVQKGSEYPGACSPLLTSPEFFYAICEQSMEVKDENVTTLGSPSGDSQDQGSS